MLPGSDKLDEKKLAQILNVSRRRVRLATPSEALMLTGYAVGTIPPFGHKTRLSTVMDAAVKQQEVVYGGGGHPDVEIRVTVAELLQHSNAKVTNISGEGSKSTAGQSQKMLTIRALLPSKLQCSLCLKALLPWQEIIGIMLN